MKKLIALTVFALVIGTSITEAQQHRVPVKKPKTQAKIGDKFYAESYFYTASEYYKDAVRQDSNFRYAAFWLAMSLMQARDYENSEVMFEKFYNIKPGAKTNKKKWANEDTKLFNKGEFYYGEMLHRNGKYDSAEEHLNKFTKNYISNDKNDQMIKLAQMEIAGCEYSKTAFKAKVKIKNPGNAINHAYNEGSPASPAEGELYYSSLPGDSSSGIDSLIFIESPRKKVNYRIMHSTYDGKDWAAGKEVDNKDVNQKGYTAGNGAFNKDHTHFYFTKCLEVADDRSLCNLFTADYSNGAFSNITRLPEPINTKEKETATQPTVRSSDDGMDIVYFVSDRKGGTGGMDIWYFMRTKGGQYKGPEVLKGAINTIGDEATPYFDDSTKTLYFSSTGQPGLGGYDIFKSHEQPDLSWGEVINVGKPLNTGADDLYFSKNFDQTHGFLASNREGSVPLNNIKTASDDIFIWRNFRYAVEGLAFKEDGGIMTDALVNLYKVNDDGTKTLIATDSTDGTGKYFFKLNPDADYQVEVVKEGYNSKPKPVTTKGLDDEDTLKVNLEGKKGTYVIKGIVYEEGKPSVTIMGANVELIGLNKMGMESTLDNSVSDPNYHFDLEKDKVYKMVTRKEGYLVKVTNVNTSGLGNVDTITKDIPIAKLELHKQYALANVLYEYNKATLTENSKAILDELYRIMVENPKFIIELSSHTDAIGGDAYNMKLSQERAQSCVDYLVSKGIAKDRLVARGYGKRRPKVPNTTEDGKDDPVGRALNRRTEFEITGLREEKGKGKTTVKPKATEGTVAPKATKAKPKGK